MPKEVEDKLKREGRAKGLKGDALDRFVFGTMNKLGLMKGNKPVKKRAAKKAAKKPKLKKVSKKK